MAIFDAIECQWSKFSGEKILNWSITLVTSEDVTKINCYGFTVSYLKPNEVILTPERDIETLTDCIERDIVLSALPEDIFFNYPSGLANNILSLDFTTFKDIRNIFGLKYNYPKHMQPGWTAHLPNPDAIALTDKGLELRSQFATISSYAVLHKEFDHVIDLKYVLTTYRGSVTLLRLGKNELILCDDGYWFDNKRLTGSYSVEKDLHEWIIKLSHDLADDNEMNIEFELNGKRLKTCRIPNTNYNFNFGVECILKRVMIEKKNI